MALYALIDRDSLKHRAVSLATLTKTIAYLQAPIVQYRAKNISTQQRIDDLKKIRSLYRGLIIVNDDIDAIEYADGLHLGQEDLVQFGINKDDAIAKIRSQIDKKLLGISTHNKVEVLEANQLALDYIGLGAYRTTNTKKEAKVGENLLEVAQASKHKVALIGGVRVDDRFEDSVIDYQVVGSDLFNYLSLATK
jgi:thiamine-phosphate pyrophosphorylase